MVDAAFLKRGERERMLELCDRLGTPAAILHCVAPMELLRERVSGRAQGGIRRFGGGRSILARQPGYWEPFGDAEQARVVAVDTSTPDAIAACRADLRSRGIH